MEQFDIKNKINGIIKNCSDIGKTEDGFGLVMLSNELKQNKDEIISEFESINRMNAFLIDTNKGLNEADNNKARTILELNKKIKSLEESNDRLTTGLAEIGKAIFKRF